MSRLNVKKNAFYTSPGFLLLGVVFSLTLFLLNFEPIEADLNSSPLLYIFSESLNSSFILKYSIYFFIFALNLSFLYLINLKLFDNPKGGFEITLLYLLFYLSSIDRLTLSPIFFASPLIIASFYYTLFYGEESKNIFYSSFLFSIATLVEFRLLIVFPVLLFLLMINRSDFKRDFLLSLTALVSPYIIVFVIRYLFFFDFIDYTLFLKDLILDFNINILFFNNLVQLLLLGALTLMLYSSISLFLRSTSKLNGISYITFIRSITLLVSLITPLFLYNASISNYFSVLFVPVSLIVFQYVFMNYSGSSNLGEVSILYDRRFFLFLILFIFLIFNRISLNL